MTEHTTRRYNGGEVLSGVQRVRRWKSEEKVRIVEETYLPGMSVSLVVRQHGISGSQIFTWRRLMAQGALTAAGAGEEVVPASEYRALQSQIAELQRLLRKKAMDAGILREAVCRAADPKKLLLRSISLPGDGRWAPPPRRWASAGSTCLPCTTGHRYVGAGDRHCPMPSWSVTSRR